VKVVQKAAKMVDRTDD
jgi:hypothetical protein